MLHRVPRWQTFPRWRTSLGLGGGVILYFILLGRLFCCLRVCVCVCARQVSYGRTMVRERPTFLLHPCCCRIFFYCLPYSHGEAGRSSLGAVRFRCTCVCQDDLRTMSHVVFSRGAVACELTLYCERAPPSLAACQRVDRMSFFIV